MEELNHKADEQSIFGLVIQSIAIILFIALLIADKGMGIMKTPIPDLWYGTIGAFGIGGIDFLKSLIKK